MSNLYVKDELLARGFALMPKGVLADREIGPSEKLLVAAMLDHIRSEGNGCVFPSWARLQDMCDLSKDTVWKALKKLRATGYLQWKPRFREDGGHAANEYTITIPPRLQMRPGGVRKSDINKKTSLKRHNISHPTDDGRNPMRKTAPEFDPSFEDSAPPAPKVRRSVTATNPALRIFHSAWEKKYGRECKEVGVMAMRLANEIQAMVGVDAYPDVARRYVNDQERYFSERRHPIKLLRSNPNRWTGPARKP